MMGVNTSVKLVFLSLMFCWLSRCHGEETRSCHDRLGLIEAEDFHHRSCAMCYLFLFKNGSLVITPDYLSLVKKSSNRTDVDAIPADARNETNAQRICDALDEDDCNRWTACCSSASLCCERQISQANDALVDEPMCQSTWDGFSCWDSTPAGSIVSTSCPAYMEHSISSKYAFKNCTADGVWMERQGFPWTDYTKCIDRESYIVSTYLTVICCSISIAFLVPSIIIYCIFRELLRQHRVRLHLHFFSSLLLRCIVTILWAWLVDYGILVNSDTTQSVLNSNPISCRALSFFKIYLTATNYFWMLCEGFFLHRLLSQAFEPPKSLVVLYSIGWGLPMFPTLVYAICRIIISNENCWARHIGPYEWIIYIPNLACLILNIVFLCNILRILTFQLHSHPHEPSTFRRGVKAAFMLIPLFGLQLVLIMYRPPQGSAIERQYEYAQIGLTNLQGVFVTLIFCLFNSEVLHYFKQRCACCQLFTRQSRTTSYSQNTSMTQVTPAHDDKRHTNGSSRGLLNREAYGEQKYELVEMRKQPSVTKKGEYVSIPCS